MQDLIIPPSSADRMPESRATSPRVRNLAAKTAVVGMIVSTAVVLGQNASFWLVPPYLLLMGWLLLVPSRATTSGESEAGDVASLATVPIEDPAPVPFEESGISDGVDETTAVIAEDPSPAKTRKGKGRGKGKTKEKARDKDAAGKPPATWVQVGPGKFVRVEGGEDARPFAVEAEEIASQETPDVTLAESVPEEGAVPILVEGSCIAHVALEETTEPSQVEADSPIEPEFPESQFPEAEDETHVRSEEPEEFPPEVVDETPPMEALELIAPGIERSETQVFGPIVACEVETSPASEEIFIEVVDETPTREISEVVSARIITPEVEAPPDVVVHEHLDGAIQQPWPSVEKLPFREIRVRLPKVRSRAIRLSCRRASGRVGAAPRVLNSRAPPGAWRTLQRRISWGRLAHLFASLPRFR